jgi:hypothetical protein
VRRLIDAFNTRDVDRFLALVTDGMEIWNPLGNAMHGVEGAREFLRERADGRSCGTGWSGEH